MAGYEYQMPMASFGGMLERALLQGASLWPVRGPRVLARSYPRLLSGDGFTVLLGYLTSKSGKRKLIKTRNK